MNRVITQDVILDKMREVKADLTPFKKLKTFKCRQHGDRLFVLDSEVVRLLKTAQQHSAYNHLSSWGYIYNETILKKDSI